MSRILFVDDDEDMLALSGRWLKKAGYDVDTVSSGMAAMDYLKSTKPDLIILDYAMPEMDGPAVLEAIKADESIKDIPVLFRTGMDDLGMDDTQGGLHPDGIVPKSEGKSSLLTAVAEKLGR